MSSKSSVLASGAVAAIIAIVLIGGVLATGILSSKSSVSTSVTSSKVPNESTSSEMTQSTTGTLSVFLTDPPTVPNGTSAVYITYNDLAVHVSGAGNESGWYSLGSGGTIDLMKVINVSQTIAASGLPSGLFNAIGFNITSAVVTFDSKNYSAYLVYREHTFFVPIEGEISITDGQTTIAVIDLTPTILLLGDSANPSFAFMPEARGYTVPSQSVPAAAALHIGETAFVGNQSWYLKSQSRFSITDVTLSPSELSITVINTGEVSINFRLAAVTALASVGGGLKALPQVAAISEFFFIYPNTSMIAIRAVDRGSLAQMIAGADYRLPPYASVTFQFAGSVSIGLVQAKNVQPIQHVIPGDRYLISITSGGRLAQMVVTAS